MLRLVLLSFFTLTFLFSSTIKKVTFEGLIHLSSDVAKDIVGLEEGAFLDENTINSGILKLYKQGYFKDIAVYNDDGKIRFVCVEKPIISKVTVKGFKESDKDKREEILGLKKGEIFDLAKINQAKERILASLQADGAIDSVVEVETELQNNGSISVDFVVSEGKKITITSLILDGLHGLTKDQIQSNAANREVQSFGWFPGRNNGELKLPELKIDPLRMKDFYMQKGYLDAQVDTPLLRVNFNTYEAELSYQIHEGIQYVVGDVSFSGQKNIVTKSAISSHIHLIKGEVFNIKTLRDDMKAIQTLIADKGYAYAQVRPDLQKDETNGIVTLRFDIVPGEKVYIRDVIISGNDRTLDRVIRREIYLAPGDLYNLSDLRDSKSGLGRTGFFKKSTIEEKRVSATQMDLIVKVQEAPTGNVQVGGGYGSYGGLSFDASLSDRNLFGSGLNMAIKLQQSLYQTQYSLALTNPRINDSDYSGSVNFFIRRFQLVNQLTQATQYTSNQAGVTLSLGKRFTRTLSGNFAYKLIDSNFTDIDTTVITTQLAEPYVKSSVAASLVFNNTDDYYVPRKGVNISNSLEVAGLGGTAKFIKETMSFATYFGVKDLIDYDAVFRYKGNVRVIKDLGLVPLDEHFYMGGLGTVRGYLAYSLPSYTTSGTARTFNATKLITNSLELSIPLVKAARVRLAFFIDYGYIGKTSFRQEGRGGYGAQVEWFSPMGPIALVFANTIDEKPGDNPNFFEFSIGRPF